MKVKYNKQFIYYKNVNKMKVIYKKITSILKLLNK